MKFFFEKIPPTSDSAHSAAVGDAQRFAQKHFAEHWWIMTLTTEIQANINNMVTQATEEDNE